jgi:predicted peroxiredoxin
MEHSEERATTRERLMIILTTGPEDRGNRATLAFAMGVSALVSGVATTMFMTMSGTFWSQTTSYNRVCINGFEPLEVYVEQFLELGGEILVCSPCHDFYCSIAPESSLLPGARLGGLTHVVDQVMSSSTVTL